MAFAQGTFDAIGQLKLPDLIDVSFDVILGLYGMHLKGLVHGDLKGANAVFARENDGFRAGLIDMGFAFKVGVEPPSFIFTRGYYGSIWFTPWELFGNRQFSGDYYKTDVWALGLVLYRMRNGKYPSWTAILDSYYDDGAYHRVDDYGKQRMREVIEREIEGPLRELNKKPSLNIEERYDRLIYQMLRLDPNKRINVAKAYTKIEQIHREMLNLNSVGKINKNN